jgi:carbonic anhydrase
VEVTKWSITIRRRVDAEPLRIVGAIYHVETGAVEILDRPD